MPCWVDALPTCSIRTCVRCWVRFCELVLEIMIRFNVVKYMYIYIYVRPNQVEPILWHDKTWLCVSLSHYGVLQKKQPSCHTHCEETCMAPFPQFNVVTSLCLERPSKKQQFRFGCRHALGNNIDQGGVGGGIRCDVTTCRRMAVFFEEPGKVQQRFRSAQADQGQQEAWVRRRSRCK